MPKAIALIPTDTQRTRLGLPSRIAERLGDRTVLAHAVTRAARVTGVEAVVLVHPAGQDPLALLDGRGLPVPLHTLADDANLIDRHHAMRTAARKWALTNWRGGLGGSLCYDELLPAAPLLSAMQAHQATSALLLGADWPFLDSDLCTRVLALNLQHPDAMRMTFTQAPPGLAGIAVSRELLQQMAGTSATFGQVIAYDPARPQADPIGRDVCVQIPVAVRNCTKRFVYDTPRTVAMIRAIGQRIDDDALIDADAMTIVETFSAMSANGQADAALLGFAELPQKVTLELNATRIATGPIVPQHHVNIDRAPMTLDMAKRIVEQLGGVQDVALTLGGLGDPLLHEQFAQVVLAARAAGVLGIAVETDLLTDTDVARAMLDLPIDVISVRLNADGPATYRKVMGVDRFTHVMRTIETLLNERNRRGHDASNAAAHLGVPWIVPRMIKTADNVRELESFFDRWTHFSRHAVIESPADGCGAMAQQSLVQMAPPKRYACRQLARHMTIHASGIVAQCDQDWLAHGSAGDAGQTSLREIWQSMQPLRRAHAAGQWEQSDLCIHCKQWYRG